MLRIQGEALGFDASSDGDSDSSESGSEDGESPFNLEDHLEMPA